MRQLLLILATTDPLKVAFLDQWRKSNI